MRPFHWWLALITPAALLAGCAGATPIGTPPSPVPPQAPVSSAPWTLRQGVARADGASTLPAGDAVTGTFMPWSDADPPAAVTYDPAVVPPGATVRLETSRDAAGVFVRLDVTGMIPRRSYGAHLHTDSCTAVPAQAGPHYQHQHDPKAAPSTPSVDPSYANPRNEVWLDFTADAAGGGSAVVGESWAFDEAHPPRSLIVHAEVTRTGKGVAGMAGPRVACLTLAPR
jgi:Cu-Zn family superoxide dismutase